MLQEKLETLRQPGRGELSARTRSTEGPDNPCVIPPESRYRGTENQLYRVEIHESGTLTQHKETSAAGQQEDDDYGLGRQGQAAGNNVATFVWSRDNGSITFPIIELNRNLAVVQHLGRDSGHALNPNDLVEVVDDDRVERSHAGKLFLVDKVDTLNATVLLKESANGDSSTDFTSTTSTGYESDVGGWQPQKAMTLGLGLKFGNASDHIDIGAIGVILGS